MKSILSTILFLFFSLIIFSQDHFLVELENRSPDVASLVMSYEGTPSIPFLANDIDGVEQALMNKTGKNVILWFWNQDCPKCIEQIDALNLLVQNHGEDLEVISFSDNSKEEAIAFRQTTPISFPVIPNSKTLAEGPYGGDLGYPKFFILDKNGVIKWAIPQVEMKNNFNTYNFLETLHISLQKS